MRTTLILTTHNRPEYLAKTLQSIQQLNPKPTYTIIVDDGSTDQTTLGLIHDFIRKTNASYYRTSQSRGIKHSLRMGCEIAFAADVDLVINLDPDTLVKPNLIQALVDLHKQDPTYIVSGFNSLNKDKRGALRNPILAEHPDHYIKQHCNGINMCFTRHQYESFIRPALERPTGNWDFDTKQLQGFKIARPSLVQHIGFNSAMGHSDDPDVAADFVALSLPSVALFGIDAHDPQGLVRAANICTSSVEFADQRIITEHNKFRGREGYSHYCITQMWDDVKDLEGTHILLIHPDGYIQNPQAWDDAWLDTDYIGASWWFKDGKNVGNGGFSLRSKRLIELLSNLAISPADCHPEDEVICRKMRGWLESEHGIRFGTTDVADRFSIEAYNTPDNRYSGQFGFHGYNVAGLPIPPLPRHTDTRRQYAEAAKRSLNFKR